MILTKVVQNLIISICCIVNMKLSLQRYYKDYISGFCFDRFPDVLPVQYVPNKLMVRLYLDLVDWESNVNVQIVLQLIKSTTNGCFTPMTIDGHGNRLKTFLIQFIQLVCKHSK